MTRFIPKLTDVAPNVSKWLPSRSNPTFTRSRTPHILLEDGQTREILDFGANPGRLRMFEMVPADLPRRAPLVVTLHGCGQSAAEHDTGTGWSQLARRHGFALLLPQQVQGNNATRCFNWYDADHSSREAGEAASLRRMIEYMIESHRLDPRRVFITGLSAGGAMSAAMLAAYPETFAAGAIIAGLPYRAADSVSQAIAAMGGGVNRSATEWGDLVRRASSHGGPWPRLSIWHGADDRTVSPHNLSAIEKQWCDVHDLDHEAAVVVKGDGHTHRYWRIGKRKALIESIIIHDMDHGAPIDAMGRSGEPCGAPVPFMFDVGISSTRNVAQFWGLTKPPRNSRKWLG